MTPTSRFFTRLTVSAATITALIPAGLSAQQLPNPYGTPINLETAKKVAAQAEGEALKFKTHVAIAVVDPAGELIYFKMMDGTEVAGNTMAPAKARSTVIYKRESKVFEDQLAGGGDGLRVLRMEGAVPTAGGVPLIADGKIAGAIGVAGGNTEQDQACAKAGASVVK